MKYWFILFFFFISCEAAQPTLIRLPSVGYQYPHRILEIKKVKTMLSTPSFQINPQLISVIVQTLKTFRHYDIPYKPFLTVIDYSKPSNQKRLWIFDLVHYRLRYYTYVAHGLNTGALNSVRFSNKNNSKASSIGLYLTQKAYRGREGSSLRLQGLEPGYNDQAENRAIVMHGGWYLTDSFIKNYGRPGRSWGCPAVPEGLVSSITHTIEGYSLLLTYYPDKKWLENSNFLQYHHYNVNTRALPTAINQQEDVLFSHVKIKHAETSPVLTLSASDYQRIFKRTVPLSRMLRRQIEEKEYIAITPNELNQMIKHNHQAEFNALVFVIPTLRMDHGYYLTEMKKIPEPPIKAIEISANDYKIEFQNHQVILLSPHHEFIRWIGL